jgi:LuxR family maltose regulon positive regulatory protein
MTIAWRIAIAPEAAAKPPVRAKIGTMQILSTKLHVPESRENIVRRPGLLERMNLGAGRKLTLVSAPAGFGKTTVVSSWNAQGSLPIAWLSLDSADRDARRFLFHLVAAIRTVAPDIGSSMIGALESAPQINQEVVFTNLINEIDGMDGHCHLVLDDYHLIDNPHIDEGMSFLLDHLPGNLHLIIITREDPQLPLARLRARNQMVEIRAEDLRFNPDDAAAFFRANSDLDLSREDILALDQRTEGWVAGLQLAAISLHGRGDNREFIRSFTSNRRYIIDYLAEEVLDRQPRQLRDFLMKTSILDEFCASLCDALTGETDGHQTLEILARKNLFLVPVDQECEWYRYHHLFADAMRNALTARRPEEPATLHRRASRWYAEHQRPHTAIRHALSAGDNQLAADLIEGFWGGMKSNYESGEWIGQVTALPEEIIRRYPVLCAGYGWVLLYQGELAGAETWFSAAEKWMDSTEDRREMMRIADPQQFAMLPASLRSARAFMHLAGGEYPQTVEEARKALELAGDSTHISRTQAWSMLGIAQYAGGDLEEAENSITGLIDYLKGQGRFGDALELIYIAADIRMLRGRLVQARRLYEGAFRLLESLGNPVLPGIEDLHRGAADIHRELGEWELAQRHLTTAREYGALTSSRPDWLHRLNISEALLELARRRPDAALESAEHARRNFMPTAIPHLKSAPAIAALAYIRMGDLDSARDWARERRLDGGADISLINEYDYLCHIRLLLAEGAAQNDPQKAGEALELLRRLSDAALAGDRGGSLIEIRMLQALAHRQRGEYESAGGILAEALEAARREGYVSLFAAEGPALGELLRMALEDGIEPGYISRLLAAGSPAEQPVSGQAALAEALSDRELDVLRLLAGDLSGPDIAGRLFISPSTMRTHTRNIYAKLQVNSRREAVSRARDLNLL